MAENLPDTNVGNIEYIRREDVLKGKKTGTFANGICLVAEPCVTVEYIESLEPADVAPVVHSRWEYKCGEIRCPECGNRIHRIDLSGCLNFCPNCGAKKDGWRGVTHGHFIVNHSINPRHDQGGVQCDGEGVSNETE